MQLPLVSVIIPVYNVAPYLDHCLRCVTTQSYAALEIILIDDGSTDNSLQICNSWAQRDARIRVLHQDNSGPSDARNAGLEVATGTFVYFMDSDDYIEPTTIAVLVEEIGEGDIVTFNYIKETPMGEELSRVNFQPVVKTFFTLKERIDFLCNDLLLYKHGWELVDSFYRRSVIEKHGLRFEKGQRNAEDLCFNLCFNLCSSGYKCINRHFYHVKMHADSIMGTSANLDLFDRFVALSQHLYRFGNKHYCSDDFDRYFPLLHYRLVASGGLRHQAGSIEVKSLPVLKPSQLSFCHCWLKKGYHSALFRSMMTPKHYLLANYHISCWLRKPAAIVALNQSLCRLVQSLSNLKNAQ